MSTPETTAAGVEPLSRFGARAGDWLSWWSNLSTFRRLAPALAIALYWGFLFRFDSPRTDHLALGAITLVLGYGGRRAQTLLGFLLPAFLTGVIYDSQRFYPHVTLVPVRVVEPYAFDQRFFGISTPEGVLTPAEWFQRNTHPLLDFLAGSFYLGYVALFVGVAAWFQFRLSRTGTARRPAALIAREAPRVMWGFFWLNMLGYLTYHIYPAAPPWYVAEHGFGPAKLDVLPSPAGCVRFDALFGTRIFTAMYSRSADVFGAIPSLHIAYPLLAAWYAFRFGALRAFTVVFFLMMCFSAVYLNHHYILDVLWGAAYALLVAALVDAVSAWRDARRRA